MLSLGPWGTGWPSCFAGDQYNRGTLTLKNFGPPFCHNQFPRLSSKGEICLKKCESPGPKKAEKTGTASLVPILSTFMELFASD